MKYILNYLLFSLAIYGECYAQTYTISLAENLPPLVEDATHGQLVDLVNEMNKLPGNIKFNILGTYEFSRSIANVLEGKADIHLPLLKSPNAIESKLGFSYTTGVTHLVNFSLFTNSKSRKIINKTNVRDYNVYLGMVMSFIPDSKGELSVGEGLKRLEKGDIDGYICDSELCTKEIENRKLSHINKQFFTFYESKGVVAKTEKGNEANKAFTNALNKLKANGALVKIIPKYNF